MTHSENMLMHMFHMKVLFQMKNKNCHSRESKGDKSLTAILMKSFLYTSAQPPPPAHLPAVHDNHAFCMKKIRMNIVIYDNPQK